MTAGCQTASQDHDWLYRQLGGYKGISQLNTTFLLTIAKDRRISHYFERIDINHLHRRLTQQFCALAAGPCTYTGETMVDAHRRLHLHNADFNALVEDLVRAMEARNIPVGAQNRLLAKLAPMRPAIVGHHPLPAAEANTSTVGYPQASGYSALPQD